MNKNLDVKEQIKKKNHSQQPEVIACQGEGESAGVSKINSGYLETGKSKEYPSADTSDKEQTNCAENFLSKYLKFKEKCINAQIFNIDEVIKLFEVYIKSLK